MTRHPGHPSEHPPWRFRSPGSSAKPSVSQYEQVLAVVLPALFALVALVVVLPREGRPTVLPLALNVAVLVILLPASSYASFSIPVVSRWAS
jgi:hypothetical protein